ncbi:MAG: amidohydrolase family protein [Proteobacteria bacterium]|nr:amidohydrolase family protein [Pseudomonadota bacterium]MCP4916987.1 amidohydrolase family protein [Pseudomonadota bacterium]
MHRIFQSAGVVTGSPDVGFLDADVRVRDGVIVEVGPALEPGGAEVVHVPGWLAPGFVQTHIHLVQTLFRGLADDLLLLDWLRTRIWPLEAAHDHDSTYWSARLGLTELLLGGTTSFLDMATVRHTDAVFQACEEAGVRAFVGRAMMDRPNEAGLSQSTEESLQGACDEADRFHGQGRLRYAFAPRFVPSCSSELLEQVAVEARKRGCLIHTHASENADEVALVRELTGRDNVVHLHERGLSGPDVCLAHCIHLTDEEEQLLADTGTRLLHCPSSNLKLGSGLARIPELIERGVHVSIGADGAPCNNRLDMFTEMRLAALIQKPRLGPTVMPAAQVLGLATRNGAEALGLEAGVIEPGKVADFIVLSPDEVNVLPSPDPASAIVYAMTPSSVREVWIGGERMVHEGRVGGWDPEETRAGVRQAIERVARRAGL